MAPSDSPPELPVDGPAAPPRANGELVFEAPWESRLFGVTLALHERGLFEWQEFQAALIAAIGAWERSPRAATEPYRYWEHWQTALEHLVAEKQLCSPEELDARTRALESRPHGHDHHHDHDHDH